MNEQSEQNLIDINAVINNTESENTSIENDDVSVMAYEDVYYSSVLRSLNTISNQQNTIIKNDEEMMKQTKDMNFSFNVIIFLIGTFFIYFYLRNMIRGK